MKTKYRQAGQLRRNILVAEDEYINRELLKNILKDTYRVYEAGNGQEAINMLTAGDRTYSLVLLDLNMPVMGGIEFLEIRRKREDLKKVPVIVMTADAEAEVRSIKLGAADFITKPYSLPEVILTRIERIIELSEDQRIWLDRELTGSDEPCIVLSHVSLADPVSGIHEREKVLSVLGRHRDRVRLVMNGHGHVDGLRYEAGIPFWDVNSASYHFTGTKYACTRYSEKLCAAYPKLSGTAPYYDPLYAIVELLDDRIRIHGTHSVFVGPTPQELGMPETENDYEPCAEIRDREILFG